MMGKILKTKNTVFICLALSFLLGVGVRSFISIPWVFTLFVIVIFSSISLGLYLKKNITTSFICLVVVLFCLGIIRYQLTLRPPDKILASLVGEAISFKGKVISPPIIGASNQQFVVLIESISFPNSKKLFPPYQYLIHSYPTISSDELITSNLSKTKMLVSTEKYPNLHIGDEIIFNGKLEEPSSFITDNGKEFDYSSYLAKDNIFYRMSFVKINNTIEPDSFNILRKVVSIRDSFVHSLNQTLHEPDSALAGGILLGVKQSLGDELEQSFIKTGLIHIIVLSGYNIGIIIWFVLWVGKNVLKTSRRTLIVVTIGLIVLFTFMVGLGASIVRAGIMAGIALFAKFFGRENDIDRALVLAGFIIILISPRSLIFDISFQLSFLATVGILYATPMFEKWLSFLPSRLGVKSIVSATFGTQLTVLPFLLWRIGTLSIIAPITNVIILPFIPIAMLASFVTGLGGILFLPLGRFFGVFTHVILSSIINVVEWFSSLPFASFSLKTFPWWVVVILYAGIGVLLMMYNKKYDRTK